MVVFRDGRSHQGSRNPYNSWLVRGANCPQCRRAVPEPKANSKRCLEDDPSSTDRRTNSARFTSVRTEMQIADRIIQPKGFREITDLSARVPRWLVHDPVCRG